MVLGSGGELFAGETCAVVTIRHGGLGGWMDEMFGITVPEDIAYGD